LIPVAQTGADWAFCRIGGQLIPIHLQEVPGVYRQVQQMLGRRLTSLAAPAQASNGMEMETMIQKLASADAV
jgi:hypothetical protein